MYNTILKYFHVLNYSTRDQGIYSRLACSACMSKNYDFAIGHPFPHPLTCCCLCPVSQIAPCYTVPCSTTTDNECLWTDWVLDNSLSGEQARQHACIKRTDGSCGWYQDGPPPEKDLLDLSDPWGQSHAKPTPHPSARPGTRHGSQFSNVYISYALIFRSQRLQRSVFKMFRVHLAIIMNVRQRVPIRRQMFIMNTSNPGQGVMTACLCLISSCNIWL